MGKENVVRIFEIETIFCSVVENEFRLLGSFCIIAFLFQRPTCFEKIYFSEKSSGGSYVRTTRITISSLVTKTLDGIGKVRLDLGEDTLGACHLHVFVRLLINRRKHERKALVHSSEPEITVGTYEISLTENLLDDSSVTLAFVSVLDYVVRVDDGFVA